jgi:hypothetical protein
MRTNPAVPLSTNNSKETIFCSECKGLVLLTTDETYTVMGLTCTDCQTFWPLILPKRADCLCTVLGKTTGCAKCDTDGKMSWLTEPPKSLGVKVDFETRESVGTSVIGMKKLRNGEGG